MFVLVLGLHWSLITGCVGHNHDHRHHHHHHHHSDVIVNVTLSFASVYNTACIRFLVDGERIDHTSFEIYKRLSAKLFQTAGVYPYGRFVESSRKKMMKRTCFKSIKLVVASENAKEKMEKTSRQVRMSDSLWLVFMNDSIPDFLSQVNLPFDVQFVVAQIRNEELVEFREAYRVDENYPLRIEEFGNWTASDGLAIPRSYLYERRSDLEGKLLRTGSIENWPMSSFREGTWDGYYPRIWKEVAAMINATTKAYRSRDNATGSMKSDGSWSGLVAMVLDNSIDVVVAEMSMNRERSRSLTFTRPVLITRYKVYFTSTGRQVKWGAAFQPFGNDVWTALLIWVVVGTMSLSFCYNYSWLYGLDASTRKVFDTTESFFFVLQSLCQQGYPIMPRSTACRIIILTCFLVSSVLIPSYSAAVISSLTHETPDRPFNTMSEMLEDGTYKLLVIPNSGQYDHFKHSIDPMNQAVLRKLIDTVPRKDQVKSIKEALDKAFCKLNNYAFLSTEKIFEMKIEYSPLNCPLVPLAEELAPVYQSLALVKNSPYRRLINFHLQKLYEIGIINRIETGIRRLNTYNSQAIFRDVDVEDSFQIFFLLTCGLMLSTIFLIMEKIHSRIIHSGNRNPVKMYRQENHGNTFKQPRNFRVDFHGG